MHPRYDMGDGSFPLDVRIGEKFLAKEINLLAHRLVDIKLKLCVMHHLGPPLHRMIDVLDPILGGAGEIARPEGEIYALELGGTVCNQLLVLGQRVCNGCIDASAGEIPIGFPLQDGPVFQLASVPPQ